MVPEIGTEGQGHVDLLDRHQFLQGLLRSRHGPNGWSPGLVEALAAACEEYFAHKGSVFARVGEEVPGILIVVKGAMRVEALEAVVEGQGAQKIVVGRLGEGDSLGTLCCLQKARSKFSYSVASRYLRGLLIPPTAAVAPKLVALLNAIFLPREHDDDDAFQMTLLEELSRRLAEEAEARLGSAGLGVRDHYIIPPECRMACLPDLTEQAARRRLPPPPFVAKPLQQVQREKRQKHQQELQEAILDLRPEVSLSAAQLREGSLKFDLPSLLELSEEAERLYRKGRPRRRKQEQPRFGRNGVVFVPRTADNPDDWRRSKAFHFCRNMPVWQPGKLEDWEIVLPDGEDVELARIHELCGEGEISAQAFEKGLRNRMSRVGGVLVQVQNAMKSGVRKLYGKAVDDAESLADALDISGAGAVDRCEVMDALTRLRIAAPQEHFEELVNVVEKDDAGRIPLDALKQAIASPKHYVHKLADSYRKSFTQVSVSRSQSSICSPRGTFTGEASGMSSSLPETQDSESHMDCGEDLPSPREPSVRKVHEVAPSTPAPCRVPCATTVMCPPLPSDSPRPATGRRIHAHRAARPPSAHGKRHRGPSDVTSASLSAFQTGQANNRDGALRRPHTAPRQGPDIAQLRQDWCRAQEKVDPRPPWSARL